VQKGRRVNGRVEIVAGLAAGDRVIESVAGLARGLPVQVVNPGESS
jgi:hypothetical protein